MNSIAVQELEQAREHHLELTLMAGRKGLHKKITHSQVQKMGLALTGFTPFINPDRLQIIGNTEMVYFNTLAREMQEKVIHQICRFLEERLSATSSLHGVLMDVFGVGVLILGKSGIGKSECALDLILRGHRLVADDMVHIQKRSPTSVVGSGFEVIRHHMEIRGLGIINIRSLFGVEAIRDKKKIELVLELTEWDVQREYDRLGFEEEKFVILDVELPMFRIPVTPARNLTTIIEVAVRNHLLKAMGYDSALEFEKKLLRKIEEKGGDRFEVEGEVE